MASSSNSASPMARAPASSLPITRMLTITLASHRVGLTLANGIDQTGSLSQLIFVELLQVGLARPLSPGGERLRPAIQPDRF